MGARVIKGREIQEIEFSGGTLRCSLYSSSQFNFRMFASVSDLIALYSSIKGWAFTQNGTQYGHINPYVV